MPGVEVNGAMIDYGDTGSDDLPVVVLIHGWLGTWDTEFGPEIEWLRSQFRVVALTRRGYGKSGLRPRTYSRDFYRRDAEDVAAWLDAIGVARAHIVGYSDGGEVAILLPIIRPDLVQSVAAWGAVGSFSPALRARVQRNYPATWVPDEVRVLHGPEDIDCIVLGWVNAMKQIIDSGGNVSLEEAHTITCPLLLMLGREDTLNPEPLGRKLVERTAQGKLLIFDCGHPVHREQMDAFRRALLAHLHAAQAS
ncbi:MAG: alpha/beta hydrolase [Anaerolineae bacterium]|nr:alpha/beta hydrolase [Anaerolineae bacterium]